LNSSNSARPLGGEILLDLGSGEPPDRESQAKPEDTLPLPLAGGLVPSTSAKVLAKLPSVPPLPDPHRRDMPFT